MKAIKVMVVAMFALGCGYLGFILYGIIPAIMFGDPRVYFDVNGFLISVWRHLLYAVGMTGIGGSICGFIGGVGVGVGKAIDQNKFVMTIPLGIFFGIVGMFMIGLAGAIFTIFPGVLYVIVLRDFVTIIVFGLYLIAFSVAGGLFGSSLVYGNILNK